VWLRVGLLAGLVAAGAAIVFDLVVAERFIDRAVAGEHHRALAVPEPFSRAGQRGGLIVGELVLGAGVAFLLAGVATFIGPRARSAKRLWVLMTAAGIWSVVLLPAIVYPPLPPGVGSTLGIGDRQLLYLTLVAVGIGGFTAAAHLWSTSLPLRRLLAVAVALIPAGLAIALLPDSGAQTAHLRAGLLTDFRIASIASEFVFWAALASAGLLLLRQLRAP
jgi:predicted cobalt transporter CbtA